MNNIRFSKTVLMLLVILGHACAFWTEKWFSVYPVVISAPSLNVVYEWCNSFHTYAFVLISGYLFAYKVQEEKYKEYKHFISIKAKRLIVPYFFTMLLWVAPVSNLFFQWDYCYLFNKYILCENPSQLWFLWMLFDVFIIIWPLRKILLDKPIFGLIISLCFYGVGLFGSKRIPNFFCIWKAFEYIPFFCFGMIMHKKEEKMKSINRMIPWYLWVLVDVCLFIATMYMKKNEGTSWRVVTYGFGFLLNITGAIMSFTVLCDIGSKIEWQKYPLLNNLSYYSMPMYLFHQQIIYFSISWFNGVVHPYINVALNFVIAVVGSYIISMLLTKWKMTRYLIGEK